MDKKKDSSTVKNDFFVCKTFYFILCRRNSYYLSLQTVCNTLFTSFIHIVTKVIIFSKGPTPKTVFYFHDSYRIEKEYKYE